MKKVNMTTQSNLIAQIPAGVDTEVIVDENGCVYLPAFKMAGIQGETSSPSVPETSSKASASVAASAPTPSKASAKSYTEEELMELKTDALLDILEEMGIDPDATKGKNTHKKVRTLILDNQGQTAAPEKSGEESGEATVESIKPIFESLETEDLDEAGVAEKLGNLGISKQVAVKAIEDFDANADLEIVEIAEKILAGDYEEKSSTRKRRGSAAKTEKTGSVDPKEFSSLEVGQKLTVECEDGKFEAEVTENSGGNVTLLFPDDNSTDQLDGDYYTTVTYR